MPGIKSVKTSSGKRVQLGSKAYNRELSSGSTAVSGTGKNLTRGDIKTVGTGTSGYKDEVSTVGAKREANAEGKLLPYQKAAMAGDQPITTPEAATAPIPGAPPATAPPAPVPSGASAPINTPSAAPTPTQNKYSAGAAAAGASGAPAPQDAGTARAQFASYAPQTPDTSAVDMMLEADPVWQSIQAEVEDYLSPTKKKDTLLSEYNRMYKSSGLDEIDEEIIDAETIIDGTEDDIRNEVQGAGGFATDSQVQAMALSRNKSLLKRYNQLVAMKQSTENRLNMMVNLSSQDKQMASTKASSQLNSLFQMANFRQNAQNNIQEGYRWMITNMGADGVYNSYKTDPTQLSRLEKSVGLAPGGLSVLATQAATERANKASMDALDKQHKQASISNIYSEIDKRNNPSPKAPTAAQAKAQGYAERTQESDAIIRKFGTRFAGTENALQSFVPNIFKSSDRQSYEQAQRDFINAALRPESGATITDSEFDNARKQYFPQAGDSASVVSQKAANRSEKIQALYREANEYQPVEVGGTVIHEGQEYIVDENGDMQPI